MNRRPRRFAAMPVVSLPASREPMAARRSACARTAEFATLLAALDTVDALAYGLAGFAMARAEQIRRARWADVDPHMGIGRAPRSVWFSRPAHSTALPPLRRGRC
jgi:hypothetical protein